MRICYLCPDRGIPLGGTKGASAHVRGLATAFSRLGHEVVVLSTSAHEGEGREFSSIQIPAPRIARDLPDKGNSPMRRALGHVWNNVSVESTLTKVMSEFQPDLVYERYSPFGVAGGILAGHHGVLHFLEVNAPLAWEGSQYRKQALGDAARFLEDAAFAVTSQLIAVSDELKEVLVEDGVDPSRIIVVPNGVDGDMFSDHGDSVSLGCENHTVIGFVGSLKPWHGIDILADAFRVLADRGSYHLLVVGSGPEARLIRSLSEECPGRVTHVEAVPQGEVASYLRAMDIAVAPYPQLDHFYYSPLKILEYMATGTAVVASSIGQIISLIDHRKTGILVPAGDRQALADAIHNLSTDPKGTRDLGAAASSVVRNRHLWIHRAQDITSLAEARVA